MAKFQKKQVVIEAITFEELVNYGKMQADNLVNGMPWSFSYGGHPITHENDDCYLIPTLEGTMKMGRTDMLITGVNGEIYPCKQDIFAKTYKPVDDRLMSWDELKTRCGTFDVHVSLFKTLDFGSSMRLFRDMLIVRAEHIYSSDVIRYEALSPLFDPVPQGHATPQYVFEIHIEDGEEVLTAKRIK